MKCSVDDGEVLINSTNIKDYIPDLPEEYFRLPDHGARSDVMRYALIYHHGGIYMDTDILVAKDLDEVLEKVTGDYAAGLLGAACPKLFGRT